MRSLRSRLIAGLLVGITAFLAVDGAALYVWVRTRLQHEQDRALESVARSVATTLFARARPQPPGDEPPGHAPPDMPPPLPEPFADGGYLLASWLQDGTPLVRSPGLAAGVLARPTSPRETATFREGRGDDGTPLRIVELLLRTNDARPAPPPRPDRPFRFAPPPPIEVAVAVQQTDLASTLSRLRWLLAIAWLTSSLGCAAILTWVVRRGLRPVERLREQIDALDSSRLDARFELEDAPAELVPVVERLDALVERLAAAFRREQAFTAHAAHELRTPLAGLRSTLELELSRPRTADEHRVAAQQCLDVALQMQTLVERLLDLARLETQTQAGPPREVVLAPLVDACWRPFAARAAERGLQLETDADPALSFAADVELLRRVLENLLENAVDHAPKGTTVDLAARVEGGRLRLRLANPAPDAPAELPERAFEPFWRGDASRSQTGIHAGLGLALCRRIAEVLGGRLTAALAGGRFAVELELPVPETGDPPTDPGRSA